MTRRRHRAPAPGPRVGRWGELLPHRGFTRERLQVPEHELQGSGWRNHQGLLVISSLVDAFLPGTQDTEVGPTWHVSVSVDPATGRLRRCTDAELTATADAFGMPAWDEDNHHPGKARHLFCPVDEAYRSACECKVTEQLIVEVDGYQWTNPTDGPCRGCQYELAMPGNPPCPIHSTVPL